MATNTTKYEIYLMNVPFNNTYSDVVLFSSHSAQANAFIGINKYHFENLNIIVKNNTFLLRGRWDKFNECNYMMWRYTDNYGTDNDHTSQWYFSFINDVDYRTRLGTTIYHTLDVWQTYHINATYNDAFIERGHILKSDDIIGKWLAPEPIGFGADFETEQNIFSNLDFTPQLCIESLSFPKVRNKQFVIYHPSGASPSKVINMSKFEYGGVSSGNSVSGYYRFFPFSNSNISDFLKLWQLPEYTDVIDEMNWADYQNYKQSNNHISDILSFSILPTFLMSVSPTNIVESINDNGEAITVGSYSNISTLKDFSSNVSINNNYLGCVNGDNDNYVPRNKKMFTSLARAFKIFNKNGLSIPLRPELFDNIANLSSVRIKIYMHTYGNEIKLELINYNDLDVNYINIPYGFSFNYGINNNVGVARDTRIAAYNTARTIANLKYIQKGIGIGAEIVGAGIGLGKSLSPISSLSGSQTQQQVSQTILNQFPNAIVPTEFGGFDVNNPNRALASFGVGSKALSDTVGLIANIKGTEFDLAVEKANAYNSQSVNIGNVIGDRLDITEDFVKLLFAECNPTYEECEIIDKFLDIYGYSINEWYDLKSFLTHRNHWNYIKVKKCNINIEAPNDDIITFNDIFKAGTTVWRNLSYVGNYDSPNN